MKKVIKLKNVTKSFGPDVILNDIDLVIDKNDVIYIHGPNGCGKSTLLKIIVGLLPQDKGTVCIGSDETIGALVENPEFSSYSTIKENLEFLYNLKNKFDERKVTDLCKRFGLDLYDKKNIKNYSVGMKQKMGIIQAIMEDQSIVLLDEPTRGLDDRSIIVFQQIMQELINDDKTIIIAAHDFIDIGFNKKIKLHNGKLYADA